jgi:hypothetical protein
MGINWIWVKRRKYARNDTNPLRYLFIIRDWRHGPRGSALLAHYPPKTNTLTRTDLDDFVRCYNPANRHQRSETERFRCFSYQDLIKRDKANLDIFWLRDDSLGDSSDLPDPAVLAAEIVEDLQAALDQFAQIAADFGVPNPKPAQVEIAPFNGELNRFAVLVFDPVPHLD